MPTVCMHQATLNISLVIICRGYLMQGSPKLYTPSIATWWGVLDLASSYWHDQVMVRWSPALLTSRKTCVALVTTMLWLTRDVWSNKGGSWNSFASFSIPICYSLAQSHLVIVALHVHVYRPILPNWVNANKLMKLREGGRHLKMDVSIQLQVVQFQLNHDHR